MGSASPGLLHGTAGLACIAVLFVIGIWPATFPATKLKPPDVAANLTAPVAAQALDLPASSERPRLSLAVLPFDRLSDDVDAAVEVLVEDLQ